jgi:hypothetical protein
VLPLNGQKQDLNREKHCFKKYPTRNPQIVKMPQHFDELLFYLSLQMQCREYWGCQLFLPVAGRAVRTEKHIERDKA